MAWKVGDKLYGWTTTNKKGAVLPTTFYTITKNPFVDPSMGVFPTIFDSNGNDITNTVLYGNSYFSQASSQTITWTTNDPV